MSQLIPRKHQVQGSIVAAANLLTEGWHYLMWEERTGKTITALLAMQKAGFKNVLVITKKNAIEGWEEAIFGLGGILHMKTHVLNYHQVGSSTEVKKGRRKVRQTKLKVDRDDYDGVIIDEAHNYIAAYPKPTSMFYVIKTVVADKKVLYMSATPHAQGYQQMFHQMKVCQFTPWQDFTDFYKWFYEYGTPNPQRVGTRFIEAYNIVDEERVIDDIDFGFSYMTRAEVGMEHEPNDVLHYIELDDSTKKIYNNVTKHKVFEYDGFVVAMDSSMKERTTLHMLEGGVWVDTVKTLDPKDEKKVKIKRDYYVMENTEKIDYILKTWGDVPGLVIMYNYKAERTKLEAIFKNAELLQATSNAEGVDLHEFDTLVIYSQDWSTFRHSQRRARQANIKRDSAIDVHYLLVKGGLSDQVYETVSINKVNFVDKRYKRQEL